MTNVEVSKIISERTDIDYAVVLNDIDVMRPDETTVVNIESLVSGFEEAYEEGK